MAADLYLIRFGTRSRTTSSPPDDISSLAGPEPGTGAGPAVDFAFFAAFFCPSACGGGVGVSSMNSGEEFCLRLAAIVTVFYKKFSTFCK